MLFWKVVGEILKLQISERVGRVSLHGKAEIKRLLTVLGSRWGLEQQQQWLERLTGDDCCVCNETGGYSLYVH